MAAIDPENKLPACTIRISFSDKITEKQLREFAKKLKSVVEQLRKEKSVGKGCQYLNQDTANLKQQDLNNSLNKIKELTKQTEKLRASDAKNNQKRLLQKL
jgi:hypothetical protein